MITKSFPLAAKLTLQTCMTVVLQSNKRKNIVRKKRRKWGKKKTIKSKKSKEILETIQIQNCKVSNQLCGSENKTMRAREGKLSKTRRKKREKEVTRREKI